MLNVSAYVGDTTRQNLAALDRARLAAYRQPQPGLRARLRQWSHRCWQQIMDAAGHLAFVTRSDTGAQHGASRAAQAGAAVQTLRILVVEDEAIVALDMARSIRRFGHEVIGPAATGQDAIYLARTQQPNLILMDIRLKGMMDGIEAARVIRAEMGVPIAYVTGQADEATMRRAQDTQPVGYLNKPFTAPELADLIGRATGRL
jgi:CheY-like chemotaxis protein